MLVHERIDFAGAQIALAVSRSAGNKDVKLADFLPQWAPEAQQGDSDEAMLAAIKALVRRTS